MARCSPDLLADRYDTASPAWADKMRLLGYYDGYLGFLSHDRSRGASAARVADLGAGTGAMAEAWTAIHGPAADLTLIDPSSGMLDQAARVLA
jgi:ubiquinone/menaquinone biosynthesis C-methylase UbiE